MKQKILITDDDISMRKLLIMVAEKMQFEVEQASDGIECLKKVSSFQPDYLILDVSMPNMDGIETLEKLDEKGLLQNLSVMMLTGKSDFETVQKIKKYGITDFLVKPVKGNTFIARLGQLTYHPTIAEIKNVLLSLHIRDESLYNKKEFKKFNRDEFSLYPIKNAKIPLIIKLPISPSPAKIYKLSDSQLISTVEVYGLGLEWKKIWPKRKDLVAIKNEEEKMEVKEVS